MGYTKMWYLPIFGQAHLILLAKYPEYDNIYIYILIMLVESRRLLVKQYTMYIYV